MMRGFRPLCLLGGALLLGASSPEPQGPAPEGLPGSTAESRSAAREFVLENHFADRFSVDLQVLRSALVDTLVLQTKLPRPRIEAVMDQVLIPAMKAHADELTAEIVEIYAANYTVSDLHTLAAFYATPLGQKALRLGPVILQQTLAATKAWAGRVLPEAIREHVQELRDRGLKL